MSRNVEAAEKKIWQFSCKMSGVVRLRPRDGFTMPFEPLRLKLLDRKGRQVALSIQSIVIRAFEKAIAIPDADLNSLEIGAQRIARVLSEGRAAKPNEYAASVLSKIAWQSRSEWESFSWKASSVSEDVTESMEASDGSSSAIIADIQVRELLDSLDDRDRSILVMRSRGFRFKEIASALGMLEVSVRGRYYLANHRLRKLATSKR